MCVMGEGYVSVLWVGLGREDRVMVQSSGQRSLHSSFYFDIAFFLQVQWNVGCGIKSSCGSMEISYLQCSYTFTPGRIILRQTPKAA